MPITAKQRERRIWHLGGSDMPAVMGVSPFASPYDVWLEKGEKAQDMQEWEGNAATDAGNRLEHAVLDYAQEEIGEKLWKNRYFVDHKGGKIIGTNTDAVTRQSCVPVEAKVSGITSPLYKPEQWGASGSDEVPDMYLIQVHAQMICTGAEYAFLAALLGGLGFRLYRIPRNEDLVSLMRDTADVFWNRNVLGDIPPENSAPSLETVKRIIRQPGKEVEVPEPVIVRWAEARDMRLRAAKHEKEALAGVLTELGDGECSQFIEGIGRFTYYEQERKGYTVAASTHRVARLKKGDS